GHHRVHLQLGLLVGDHGLFSRYTALQFSNVFRVLGGVDAAHQLVNLVQALASCIVGVQGEGFVLGTFHCPRFTAQPLDIDLNMGAAVKNLILVVDFSGTTR